MSAIRLEDLIGIAPPPAADFITILTTTDGKRLAKRHYLDAEGQPQTEDYDRAYLVKMRQVPVNSLAEVHRVMTEIKSDQCIVWGKPLVDENAEVRRLYHDQKDGAKATLADQAHNVVFMDFDLPPEQNPLGVELLETPHVAAEYCIALLPTEFRGTAYVYQLTSSAGIKPGIRLRLVFWLEQPITAEQAKRYLTGSPVDLALYTPNQVIYAAAPIFGEGRADPVLAAGHTRTTLVALDRAHAVDNQVPGPAELRPEKKKAGDTRRSVAGDAETDTKLRTIDELIETAPFVAEACKALHYVDLRRPIIALGRMNIVDDPDKVLRYDLAAQVRNANTVSKTMSDYQIERLLDLDLIEDGGINPETWFHYAKEGGYAPKREAAEDEVVVSYGTPFDTAKEFVRRCCTVKMAGETHQTLIRHRGSFYTWTRTHYQELPDETMTAAVYRFLNEARVWVKVKAKSEGEEDTWTTAPFNPDQKKYGNVRHALVATGILVPDEVDAPAWLDESLGRPTDLIVCRNGLLDMAGKLQPHDPRFLTFNALPFDFDAAAPEPVEWLKFLGALWPHDQQSIDMLQEWFGYLISGRTDQQKLLYLIGPKRSGKGTILRTIEALLGTKNVSGLTLEDLRGSFGMQPLIDKSAMLVGDSRMDVFGGGQGTIVSRLLSITGEDSVSVQRKGKKAWNGRLSARVVIASNETARFNDVSGTIATRITPLKMTVSFFGREDRGLEAKIRPELPGILNWSLAGLRRLLARGHFVVPASAEEEVDSIRASASQITAFVNEKCCLDPDKEVECERFREAFKGWTGQWQMSPPEFGRQMRAAFPQIERVRSTLPLRPWVYCGVALLD